MTPTNPPPHDPPTGQDPPTGPNAPGPGADGESSAYGFPAPLWRTLEHRPPPGLGRVRAWRSPLRGPWLTSVFGLVLLVGLPIVIITGLLSYIAYAPQLNQAIPADVGWLHLPVFNWPSTPSWLYRLNQGLHVGLGLILRVNGVDLSLEHGFPARIIVPALPGVHNTKWVRSLEFRSR